MKKIAFICTVFILIGWSHLTLKANPVASDMYGTWELVDFNHGGGHVVVNPGSMKRVKNITEDGFIWVHFKSSDMVASASAGGSYTIQGNTYTEMIDYGSDFMKSFVGSKSVFTYTVNGDFLNIEGKLGNGLHITERWKKVVLPKAHKMLMDEHYNLDEDIQVNTIYSDNRETILPIKKIQGPAFNLNPSLPLPNTEPNLLVPDKLEVMEDNKNNIRTKAENLGEEKRENRIEKNTLQHLNISGFKVYPNPASQVTTLSFMLQKEIVGTISLVDLNGQECQVFKERTKYEAGNYQINIELNNVAAGIYLLTLKSTNGVEAQKLIVK